MRKVMLNGLIYLVCPATIVLFTVWAEGRYALTAALTTLYVVLVFLLSFERRKPKTKEVVLTASLCALGVAGRMAFFWLPQIKPVAALAILTGMVFGGHTGFVVGAMTALVSNFFFGQGPWTAYQMFAFGLIGLLAGYLPKSKPWVVWIYGGLSVFFLYGGIMNGQSYFFLAKGWNPALFLTTWAAGVPFDLIHAVSTVFFLAVFTRPFLAKVGRIQKRYGFMEKNVLS